MNKHIPNIGFGCASLTSIPYASSALRLLETAFDLGIIHFDSAPLYGRGYSEILLGKFIKSKRKSLTITTKFGLATRQSTHIPVDFALPLNYISKKFSTLLANSYNPASQVAILPGGPVIQKKKLRVVC